MQFTILVGMIIVVLFPLASNNYEIMPASVLIILTKPVTNYSQNYSSIIGSSLVQNNI